MAVSFERGTQLITFCDSPQYVVLKSDSASTYLILNVYVWQGLKANKPSTPQRALRQDNLVADGSGDTYATFEVSNYISEFVENDTTVGNTNTRGINSDIYIGTTYGATEYNGQNGTWYQFEADDSGVEEPISDLTKFATLGKGYYSHNMNPGTNTFNQANKIYGNHANVLFGDPTNEYIVPVYIGDDSNNKSIISGGVTKTFDVDFGFTLQSTDSAEQIGYIVLSGVDWGTAWDNGREFTYTISDQIAEPFQFYTLKLFCGAGNPKSLKYLNTFGSVSDFPINGSDRDSVSIKKTTFTNDTIDPVAGGYDVNGHVQTTFFVDAQQSVELETGWIDESANVMAQEMLISKWSWYEAYNFGQPAHITTSRLKFIYRLYGKQMGYTINIDIAQPLLNTVR